MSDKTYITEADFINGILLRPVDFEVPDLGWVEVRGLSAVEIDDLQTKHKDRPVLTMLEAVEKGLINPKLSAAGVQAMNDGNPAPIEAISRRILELSGRGNKEEQDPLAGSSS